MKKTSKIFIAGHNGLVGSALLRNLQAEGYKNIVTKNRSELDLMDTVKVMAFFKKEKFEYVFNAAAKVGGIMANKNSPADFFYENIMIQSNVVQSAYVTGVKKLLFIASSCIYPKMAPQPIKEDSIMTGPLEATNQAFAMAKLAGVEMCRAYNEQYGTDFITVMLTNLYGPNDNFDLEKSHVLPALIHRFHDAKEKNLPSVTLWGNGSALREFLYTDDLAKACIFLMDNYDKSEIINVGTGEEVSIKELAELVKNIVGFKGKIEWDTTKPNGTPRKLLDVSKLNALGWKSSIKLKDGLKKTYEWFKANESK